MAGRKKKVGGVKRASRQKKRRAPAPPVRATKEAKQVAEKIQRPSKTVGGVKPSVRRAVTPHCSKCEGFYHHGGNWHHSIGCSRMAVGWKAAGVNVSNWYCVYGCQPTVGPSQLTHRWDCPFWDATDETPF